MRGIGILLLGLFLIMPSCRVSKKASLTAEIEEEEFVFPMDWIGHYQGQLKILSPTKDTTQIGMQLIVDYPDALGVYPWVLIYGKDDIRSYGLEAVNAVDGHYLIDEYNSIKIDSYLSGNHFVSRFSVMGSDLLVDYERVSEGVEVKLYVSQSSNVNETGGEIIAKDTVPRVNSYRMLAVQEALLLKIK